MRWNPDEVKALLGAEISEEPASASHGTTTVILRFKDSVMRYEIWLVESMGIIILSADPQEPMQGLPFFEISLPCTDLAPLARGGMPTGLGIFSGGTDFLSLLFTITRREDGNISLSGMWDGMFRRARTALADEIPPASEPTR